MYPGTIFVWHDQSAITNRNVETVDNSPLYLVLSSFDRGTEDLTEVSGRQFYQMYGSKMSFARHGQPALQAANCIDGGARLLVKRLVADDAKLANLIGVATVTSTVNAVKTDPDDPAGKTLEELLTGVDDTEYAAVLDIISTPGATDETTSFSVEATVPHRAGGVAWYWKASDNEILPVLGKEIDTTEWTEWDGVSDLPIADGLRVSLVEYSEADGIVSFGTVVVVSKAPHPNTISSGVDGIDAVINLVMTEGTEIGTTKAILSHQVQSGDALIYKVGEVGDVETEMTSIEGYTEWNGKDDISVEDGANLVILEVKQEYENDSIKPVEDSGEGKFLGEEPSFYQDNVKINQDGVVTGDFSYVSVPAQDGVHTGYFLATSIETTAKNVYVNDSTTPVPVTDGKADLLLNFNAAGESFRIYEEGDAPALATMSSKKLRKIAAAPISTRKLIATLVISEEANLEPASVAGIVSFTDADTVEKFVASETHKANFWAQDMAVARKSDGTSHVYGKLIYRVMGDTFNGDKDAVDREGYYLPLTVQIPEDEKSTYTKYKVESTRDSSKSKTFEAKGTDDDKFLLMYVGSDKETVLANSVKFYAVKEDGTEELRDTLVLAGVTCGSQYVAATIQEDYKTFKGKKCSELQHPDVFVDYDGNVTGTFNYVENYLEKSGYFAYLSLIPSKATLKDNSDSTLKVGSATIKLNGEESDLDVVFSSLGDAATTAQEKTYDINKGDTHLQTLRFTEAEFLGKGVVKTVAMAGVAVTPIMPVPVIAGVTSGEVLKPDKEGSVYHVVAACTVAACSKPDPDSRVSESTEPLLPTSDDLYVVADTKTTVKWTAVSVTNCKTHDEVMETAKALLKEEEPTVQTNEDGSVVVNRGTSYPLFVVSDNGRGASNKAIKFSPDYTTSKDMSNMFYTVTIFDGSTQLDKNTATLNPSCVWGEKLYGINPDVSLQVVFDVVPGAYEGYMEAMVKATGLDRETLLKYDLIYGTTNRQASIPGIVIDPESIDFDAPYGVAMMGGDNGEFGDAPFGTEAWIEQALRLFEDDQYDIVYDRDVFKIHAIFDANYPLAVKDAIADFVSFREDCVFFRDFGIDVFSYASIVDYCENNIKAEHKNKFCLDYYTTYQIYDPYTKVRERVTMMYDFSRVMVAHFTNGAFRPMAGVINGMILENAIEGTINFTPRHTPRVNQKALLDDLKINYAIFQDGQCVVQSLYTSQENYTQLSYGNNVLAVQEVMRAVRTACPKHRFAFTTDNDFSAYAEAVNNVLRNFNGNFALLKFDYEQDNIKAANKIFYGVIYFRFNNWAQTEHFDLYALGDEY